MRNFTAYYLDANGDGLKDILGLSERAAVGPSLIAYNTGSGFIQQALGGFAGSTGVREPRD
jgi:hypothetical protein